MKTLYVTISIFAVVFTTVPISAQELATKWPFAIVTRFTENAEALGFLKGRRLSIGVFAIHGDYPITDVTLRNLDTGVTLKAISAESISHIFTKDKSRPILYEVDPMPAFDPGKHKGVWEAVVTDEKGNSVADKTHNLDKVGEIPFVEGLSASGDALRPVISWDAPSVKSVPEGCETQFRVRLLKDINNQLHRSKALNEPKYDVPDGILKNDDLLDTYVRVEFICMDKDDKDHPVPIEIRSDTFVSLKELIR